MHKICVNLIDRFWTSKPKCVIQIMHLVSLNNIESLIEPQEREGSVVIFSGLLEFFWIFPEENAFPMLSWIRMDWNEIPRDWCHSITFSWAPFMREANFLQIRSFAQIFSPFLLFPCNFRSWKTFILSAPTFKNDCCKIRLILIWNCCAVFIIETVRKILLRKQTRYKTRMTCWT